MDRMNEVIEHENLHSGCAEEYRQLESQLADSTAKVEKLKEAVQHLYWGHDYDGKPVDEFCEEYINALLEVDDE